MHCNASLALRETHRHTEVILMLGGGGEVTAQRAGVKDT